MENTIIEFKIPKRVKKIGEFLRKNFEGIQNTLTEADFDEASILSKLLPGECPTMQRGTLCEVTLNDISYDQEKNTGILYVTATYDVYMGCRDMDNTSDEEYQLRFSLTDNKMIIEPVSQFEREPDEF